MSYPFELRRAQPRGQGITGQIVVGPAPLEGAAVLPTQPMQVEPRGPAPQPVPATAASKPAGRTPAAQPEVAGPAVPGLSLAGARPRRYTVIARSGDVVNARFVDARGSVGTASLGRVSELAHFDIASNVSTETLEHYAHRVVAMGMQGDIMSAAYSQILDDLRRAPVVDDWDRKLQQEHTRKCQCKVRVQVLLTKDDVAAFEKEENLTGLFEQAIDAGARRGLYESDISQGKATSPVTDGRGGGEFRGFPVHPPGLDADNMSRGTKQSIRVTMGEHKKLNPPRFCFIIVIRYSCNCVLKVWYNRELEQYLPLATSEVPTLTPVLNPATGQVSQMQLVSADGRTYQDDSSEDVQTRLISDSSPAEKSKRGGGACTLMWVDCPSMPGPQQPAHGQNRWRWLIVAEASAAGCAPAYHMATIEFQPGDAKPSVKKEWDL